MEPEIQSLQTLQGVITKLIRYNIDSPIDEILPIMNSTEKEKFYSLNHHKRRCEYYYTRLLWREFNSKDEIRYDNNGAPHIDHGYISISHSSNIIGISYHPTKKIGLDLQYYTPKIIAIKDKFANQDEYNSISENLQEDLTALWCIKEAVYKMARIKGLPFKKIQAKIVNGSCEISCDQIENSLRSIEVFSYKDSDWALAVAINS